MPKPLNVNTGDTFTLLYHAYQQAFLQARRQRLPNGLRAFDRFCLISGRRGGKTLVGAIAAVEESSVPNSIGWCIAPTYGDLHDYVIPAVFKVLPQSWILPGKDGWSAFHQRITLRNNAQIAFRSADDPERMRGQGLHWLWLDEARKTQKLVWETVKPSLTEHRGAAFITTSPNGYDWVYKTFWRLAQNPKYQEPGYWAVKYKTIDNPAIPRDEIERARRTTDELWFRQEYEGEFVSFEGAIYGHRVEPCVLHTDDDVRAQFLPEWPEIPPNLPVIIGLDPGADHPFAAVKLVVTHRGLLLIDEYSRRQAAFADHVDVLRRWAIGHGEITWAIDRSASQAQIELAALGIHASAAENHVVLGIQRVQSWMKSGRFGVVEARCPMTLDELRSYRWKNPITSIDGDEETSRETPYKVHDDLCDALRYGVMLWPELPEAAPLLVGRDPNTVPEQCRAAWLREQRARRDRHDETDWAGLAPTGDMWGGDTTDVDAIF